MTPLEASAPSMKKAQSRGSTAGGSASGGPSMHGGSATPLGAGAARDMPAPLHACQEGENDFAEVVVVFEPQGTSLMMGGLHPRVRPPPLPPTLAPSPLVSCVASRYVRASCNHADILSPVGRLRTRT